jgi:hypothetical protein
MPGELNELFFGFLKVLFVAAGVIYVIFSVVAIRQIHTMQKSLMTSVSDRLKALGYIHLVFAILVLLFFIVSL